MSSSWLWYRVLWCVCTGIPFCLHVQTEGNLKVLFVPWMHVKGVEVELHSLWTLARDGFELSASLPYPLYPQGKGLVLLNEWETGGHQCQYGHFRKRVTLCVPAKNQPSHCPVCGWLYVAVRCWLVHTCYSDREHHSAPRSGFEP